MISPANIRCAILDDYQNVALTLADWTAVHSRVDVRVFQDHFRHESDLVAAIKDCQIVVAMRERTPFPRALFARLPNLKLLVTTGMKNAAIDLAAARDFGVLVSGTESLVHPTAELTWGLILTLARRIPLEAEAFRRGGRWQQSLGTDLKGKRLGIVGLGRLGTRVALIARAFEMEVVAWSQNLTAERCRAAGASLAGSLDELLATSDFVSLHLVLSERTRGLIGERELRRMKRSAFLINTSRGPIVDESALLKALTEGWIAGAGIDVFDEEPVPPDHPLRRAPNLVATPHIGYVTEDNYRLFYGMVVENIAAWLSDAPIRLLNAP